MSTWFTRRRPSVELPRLSQRVRPVTTVRVDLHEVMLARETASLHFQLAVQVRNKLVEAYQDVMRMQI